MSAPERRPALRRSGTSSQPPSLYVEPSPESIVQAAQRSVAANAVDGPEAARLLEMLGILPGAVELAVSEDR